MSLIKTTNPFVISHLLQDHSMKINVILPTLTDVVRPNRFHKLSFAYNNFLLNATTTGRSICLHWRRCRLPMRHQRFIFWWFQRYRAAAGKFESNFSGNHGGTVGKRIRQWPAGPFIIIDCGNRVKHQLWRNIYACPASFSLLPLTPNSTRYFP